MRCRAICDSTLAYTGTGSRVRLRIGVDEQHLSVLGGQCRRKIYRCRRLTNTAFLIGDRNDLPHMILPK